MPVRCRFASLPSHALIDCIRYLRNVLFEYLTGPHQKRVIKAISTVMDYSPQQQQAIEAKEEERQKRLSSWF